MYNLTIFKTLGAGDFKAIKRDSMLSWLVLMPVILALLIRILVPRLTVWLFETWNFDLTPFYPVIMSAVFILAAPVMFGFIIGFLLLDERDDGTLTALQVTPLTLNRYLVYRAGLPIVVTMIMIPLLFPMTNLMTMPANALVAIAVVAGLEAPIFALLMAAYAENKVAGFALMKGMNLIIGLPLLAYFFQGTIWEVLLAIIPTYWPMKTFWVAAAGGNFGGYFVIGLLYHSLLLALLLKRFDKVTHRQ
jgi:fluoroquinolone transport system permease protein